MSLRISKTNDRVRVTDFSPWALLVTLALVAYMAMMSFQLSDDWMLPDSFVKKSSRALIDFSPYQDTVLFFTAVGLMACAFAWVGTYTSVLFDLSSGQVQWKRISVKGRKSLTFPLASVTNLFVESSAALGTRSRGRYNYKVMLSVEGRLLDLSQGESRVDAKKLVRYQKLIEEARAAIWPEGEPAASALPSTDDPQQVLQNSGLSVTSPGVYVLSRFHLVVLAAVATLLFLLYMLLNGVPGYWATFQESLQQINVMQALLSFAALTIIPLALVGGTLLFTMIGVWDRITFDTQKREIRKWHLGFLGWSGRKYEFDEVVEVRIQEQKDDADARFDVRGVYTQVVLVTRDAQRVPVNDNSYGAQHQVACVWLAAALRQLLEIDEHARTAEAETPSPARRRLVKRPVLTTFWVLLAAFAVMSGAAFLSSEPREPREPAARAEAKGLPPLDEETRTHPPAISVDQATYDFGTINTFSTIHPKFELKNTGVGPLQIQKLTASRNEIYPQVGREVLAPGESTVLEFEYKLGSTRGRQDYTVTVQTNDPKQRELTLQVTGETVPLISTDPYPLVIAKTGDEAAVGTVLVTTKKDVPFHIVDTKTSGKHVSVKIEPVEEGRQYRAIVTVRKDADIQQGKRSRFSEWVHLMTDDKGKYGRLAFAVKGEFAR